MNAHLNLYFDWLSEPTSLYVGQAMHHKHILWLGYVFNLILKMHEASDKATQSTLSFGLVISMQELTNIFVGQDASDQK